VGEMSLTKVLAEEGSLRVVWWLLFLTWVVPHTMEKLASVLVSVEVEVKDTTSYMVIISKKKKKKLYGDAILSYQPHLRVSYIFR
jgi:hypothetical protein